MPISSVVGDQLEAARVERLRPEQHGLDVVRPRFERTRDDLLRRAVTAERVDGHTDGGHCQRGYGSDVRTGSTSRPRYVLHVGHMRCDSFGLPQTGQTESLGASILCWARRLSRRDFDVFRFGTAMSGRLAYLRARRLRFRYGLRLQVVPLEHDQRRQEADDGEAAPTQKASEKPLDERLRPRRCPSRAGVVRVVATVSGSRARSRHRSAGSC